MGDLSTALRQMQLPPDLNRDLLNAAADQLDRLEVARTSDHNNTMHMMRVLSDTFREEKSAWQTERERLDKVLDEVMAERDEYHEMADRLAHAIADHLLVPIGEHSSSNCPWMRALEEIQNANPAATANDGEAKNG